MASVFLLSDFIHSSTKEEQIVNQIQYEGMWLARDVDKVEDIFNSFSLPPFLDYLIYPLSNDMYLVSKDIESNKERIWNIATDIFVDKPYFPDMQQVVEALHYSWSDGTFKPLYTQIDNESFDEIELDNIDV